MACRRCSECEGMQHHWIENTALVDDDDPSFVCKHCPAVGEFYSIAEGVDGIDDDDDVIVEIAR